MVIANQRRVIYGSVIGQVTTVGTNTTYTGLCLSNPNSSKVNLSVIAAGFGFTVAFPAASVIGLMRGFSTTDVTHTAAVTPYNQFGQGTPTALLDSSATLPATPTVEKVFGAGLTGAITTAPFAGGFYHIDEGEIVLPPGSFLAFYTSTVSGTAAGSFSFKWEELPFLA